MRFEKIIFTWGNVSRHLAVYMETDARPWLTSYWLFVFVVIRVSLHFYGLNFVFIVNLVTVIKRWSPYTLNCWRVITFAVVVNNFFIRFNPSIFFVTFRHGYVFGIRRFQAGDKCLQGQKQTGRNQKKQHHRRQRFVQKNFQDDFTHSRFTPLF